MALIESTHSGSRWNENKKEWVPLGVRKTPLHSSNEYPKWICKSACRNSKPLPENTKSRRCPNCKAPLIRYIKYEQKS